MAMSNVIKYERDGIMPVYEDGYGDDGCPIYKCPSCYVDVYEHQKVCKGCKQNITWD